MGGEGKVQFAKVSSPGLETRNGGRGMPVLRGKLGQEEGEFSWSSLETRVGL